MDQATAEILATAAVNITGMACLVYYSVNRKFKADDPAKRSWKEWLDRWRVEIIIGAVLVPQWADWVPKLIKHWVGG